MRKLLLVAATTATLGGLGLTATAQAQPGGSATPAALTSLFLNGQSLGQVTSTGDANPLA